MQLLTGDCLDLMKTLPDKSIDLFVCDLPYGCLTGAGKDKRIANVANRYRKECAPTDRGERVLSNGTVAPAGILGGCAWDIKIDLESFWVQIKRLCRNDHTPVLMFCNTKFGFELYNSNPDWFRYDLVWNKSRGVSFLQANKAPLRSHEMIYVFAKKGATYYRTDIVGDFPAYVGSHSAAKVYNLSKPDTAGYKKVDTGTRCVKSVVSINNESNKGGKHPTQKPAALYEWLLTRYSKEGDTILDPTAGSFASVFTAHTLNRIAIGMELNKDFYDKAVLHVESLTK